MAKVKNLVSDRHGSAEYVYVLRHEAVRSSRLARVDHHTSLPIVIAHANTLTTVLVRGPTLTPTVVPAEPSITLAPCPVLSPSPASPASPPPFHPPLARPHKPAS